MAERRTSILMTLIMLAALSACAAAPAPQPLKPLPRKPAVEPAGEPNRPRPRVIEVDASCFAAVSLADARERAASSVREAREPGCEAGSA